MKIAHVVDSLEVGGAEMLVSQMCRLQRDDGHSPRIYAIATLGVLGEQLQKEDYWVQPEVGHHLLDSSRSFFRIFKESKPDVVHLHNPTPTIYAAIAARMAGVPSIVSTRHSLVDYGVEVRDCGQILRLDRWHLRRNGHEFEEHTHRSRAENRARLQWRRRSHACKK